MHMLKDMLRNDRISQAFCPGAVVTVTVLRTVQQPRSLMKILGMYPRICVKDFSFFFVLAMAKTSGCIMQTLDYCQLLLPIFLHFWQCFQLTYWLLHLNLAVFISLYWGCQWYLVCHCPCFFPFFFL